MDPLSISVAKEIGVPLWKLWLARRSKRVLVVEDYEPHAELMKYLIHRIGFAVDVATHADTALALLASHQYRAAFVDINLPGGMNGLELAEIMHRKRPAMKIIIASGDDDFLAKLKKGTRWSIIRKDVTLQAVEDAIYNGK